jgi:hypothetical protein
VKFLSLCVVLALLLLGCKKGERAQRDLDSLYSKAYSQKASGDISLAIESFQRLLALDSLRATTYRLELLSLYEQTGNFRTALALLDSLPPIDSLQAKRLIFLSLLGETDALKKYLRKKFPLTPADELLLAELYLKEKEYDRAQFHLAAVSQSSNALAAIEALGKLAMLFDGYRQNGADSSTFFLRKLSDMLTERLRKQPPLEERFELLYRSAEILSDYDAFTSDADSLFEQALNCLKQKDWRGATPEMLSAWITLMRNTLGTPENQSLERALLTCRIREHRLGEAFATLLLGKCHNYSPSRRINLLIKSLELFEALPYPELPDKISLQLDDAINELLALLLEQERLLEAFEISERLKTLKQRFALKPLRTPLSPDFEELNRLQGDIWAVAIARDSLAFLTNDAERIDRVQRFSETLSIKQGEFYQKFMELKSKAPAEAERLFPKPITLSETARLLKPDEVLIQLMFGEAKSYLLVITESNTHVLSLAITHAEMKELFKILRFELLNGLPFDSTDVIENEARRTLTALVFEPLLPFISERATVYVMSNAPCPIHILGKRNLLGETHQLSYLTSAKQLQLANFAPSRSALPILALDEIDIVPFDLSPQEALLEWGRLDNATKLACTSLSRPLAEAYRRFAQAQSARNQYTWINLSCYGK